LAQGKWTKPEMSAQWRLYTSGGAQHAAAQGPDEALPPPAPRINTPSQASSSHGSTSVHVLSGPSSEASTSSSASLATTSTASSSGVQRHSWNEFQSLAKGLGWSKVRMSAEYDDYKQRGRLPDQLMQRLASPGAPHPSTQAPTSTAGNSTTTSASATVTEAQPRSDNAWNRFQALAKGLGWSKDKMSAEYGLYQQRGRLPDELLHRTVTAPGEAPPPQQPTTPSPPRITNQLHPTSTQVSDPGTLVTTTTIQVTYS
jgi:hypothetical protein